MLRIATRVFRSIVLLAMAVVGVPVVAAVTILVALIYLPLPATIPVAKASPIIEPTVIYDAAGRPIATLTRNAEDVPVRASQIPAVLEEAVISDEDANFYHEGGVDLKGIVRAFVADVRNERIVQGGSTIAEQYVKLAYTSGRRTLLDKIREAVLASQLDREASKNEILYRYLTTVYFGDGNYGVGAAAENYFHVGVEHLDASQSATLAGLIPAPSARAPREHLASAEDLRELVLGKMRAQGYLTPAAYSRAMRARLALSGQGPVKTPATLVYAAPRSTSVYPPFVSYVTSWLLQRYPPSEVYGGGLRVQSTLQPAVQAAAQRSVAATLAGTKDPLEMALAAVQPQTGFIEALVGHRANVAPRFANDDFALGGCPARSAATGRDVVKPSCQSTPTVTGGGGGRQPGSAWKPFVLATAFERGIPPTTVFPAPAVYAIPGCRILPGQPATACTIHNDEGESPGRETLAAATVQSTNTVYAQLAARVGCANVARTARALGITSAYYNSTAFPYCESYALGELGVSPLDMASAYGVFADHGRRAAPTPVLEIVNQAGKVILDNIAHAPATTRVLPANVADNVTRVLQGVITSGTGTAAAIGRPAAGKTGTTSNTTDAWFVGYTPTLSTAVWMGNAASEAKSISPLKGVAQVYGGTFPAETWHAFMRRALAGVPVTQFDQPAPIRPPAPLVPTTTSIPPPVGPGETSPVSGTPTGGPYQGQAPKPVAVPPPTTVPPTTVPPTTVPPTTVPPTTVPPTTVPPTTVPP
jgi:penicillin-binding protein 1A